MGTHPIFESDFDCLTDMASYGYISDLGSIDDEIDIKVFKTNKDGETTVTEQQPADKKTKPKATKEAAKKPAAAKPSEEESEYTGIYDYYSNINDKIQIKVYKDQPAPN